MRLSAELKAFQGRLGHEFRQPDLLVRAVTHASIGTTTRPDNQRLEFLGDRVLGLSMADALLSADTHAREGQLAPRFNALVRKETCAKIGEGTVQPRAISPSPVSSGANRRVRRKACVCRVIFEMSPRSNRFDR